MGYPSIIVCGKSTLESPPKYEVYSTRGGNEPRICALEEINVGVEENNVETEKI